MQRDAKITYTQDHQIGVGQGLNSKVYLADDPQLGGKLAVKEIEKANFVNVANYWDEAQAMFASLHENVVPIRYACETNDHVCLAMPYYAKGSLTDRITRGPLRLLEVIRVGQGILSGVMQIHIAGQVHFDIKPSNVLFADDDTPMVADFGQARAIGPTGVSVPGGVYCSVITPELLLFNRGVPQTDLYQVGLCLYRAANGEPFYQEEFQRKSADILQVINDGTFPDRGNYMPHTPRAFRKLIRKALSVDVAARYASAMEFAQVLGKIRVTNDWETACHSNDEIEWRARRSGKPNLLVALRYSGAGWRVTVYNERPNACRATKKPLWREFPTRPQAFKYLKQVFEALE